MQTLVIIPVGRETVDKILVVSLLVLYNQGGDRDIKTSKESGKRNEQESASYITLENDITLQDIQPQTVLEC